MAAVFAAAATEPTIGRGLARLMNLLVTPTDLMADGEFLTAVSAVMADPGAYPPPANDGPSRSELLAALADDAPEGADVPAGPAPALDPTP